jgi:hypothetical protein
MAQKIRIKRRNALGGAGAPSTLSSAELAFNENSKILYYGLGDTGSGEAQTVIPIGGEGAFLPSGGGAGGYVKSITVTPDTGISDSQLNGDVTLAGIDASKTAKGVVRLATQAEYEAGTPGVVPGADLILANAYELPVATASELGGITVGDGLSIDPSTGKLDVTLAQGTVYKGEADFTDGSAEPGTPENGWIYTNNTDGTAAWTGIVGEAVVKGVQAIWSEADSEWSIIVSGGGVATLSGQDPIEVDVATNGASDPIVKIKDGAEDQKGAVEFATDAQITNGAALVAVQASQLKDALDDLDPLPTGSVAGDLMQWDPTANSGNGAWLVSNDLDGGTF